MSHHGNDLAYDQRMELYLDSLYKFINEGHAAGVAEDMALAIVERDIEKSEYIREEQEWDARGE